MTNSGGPATELPGTNNFEHKRDYEHRLFRFVPHLNCNSSAGATRQHVFRHLCQCAGGFVPGALNPVKSATLLIERDLLPIANVKVKQWHGRHLFRPAKFNAADALWFRDFRRNTRVLLRQVVSAYGMPRRCRVGMKPRPLFPPPFGRQGGFGCDAVTRGPPGGESFHHINQRTACLLIIDLAKRPKQRLGVQLRQQ
jgi:hypothetical protein